MVKLLTSDVPPQPLPPSATVSAERSFPLVTLLQLATFWAALTACVDGAKLRSLLDRHSGETAEVALAIAAAFLVGGILGGVIGLGQLRMWRGAVAGFAAGGIGGMAMLAVYVAPAAPVRALAAAAMMLLTTLVFRCRAA